MIALGQVAVVGPAVARFASAMPRRSGILVAVAVYIGYAFTTSTIGAFLLLIPIALQAPVQPSLMAMMSRRATADTQGEVQGISAMAMGLGQLAAPMLLTGAMAYRRCRAGAFPRRGVRRRDFRAIGNPDASPPAARYANGGSDAAVGDGVTHRRKPR